MTLLYNISKQWYNNNAEVVLWVHLQLDKAAAISDIKRNFKCRVVSFWVYEFSLA